MATSAQVVPVASVYQSLLAGDIGRPYYTARTSLNTLALLDPLTDDEVREGGPNSDSGAISNPARGHRSEPDAADDPGGFGYSCWREPAGSE